MMNLKLFMPVGILCFLMGGQIFAAGISDVVFPKVDFENADLKSVVEFINTSAPPDSAGEKIKCLFVFASSDAPPPKLTYQGKQVKLLSLLSRILNCTKERSKGYVYFVEQNTVLLLAGRDLQSIASEIASSNALSELPKLPKRTLSQMMEKELRKAQFYRIDLTDVDLQFALESLGANSMIVFRNKAKKDSLARLSLVCSGTPSDVLCLISWALQLTCREESGNIVLSPIATTPK